MDSLNLNYDLTFPQLLQILEKNVESLLYKCPNWRWKSIYVHTLQEFYTFGIVITCGKIQTSIRGRKVWRFYRVRFWSINFNFLRSCVKIASLRCPFIITVHCFTPFYLVKKFLMNKQKAKSSIGVGKAVVSNYADTVLVWLLTNQTRCWYTVVVDKADTVVV